MPVQMPTLSQFHVLRSSSSLMNRSQASKPGLDHRQLAMPSVKSESAMNDAEKLKKFTSPDFLHDKLIAKLEKAIGKEGVLTKQRIKSSDFSPQAVAKRILGFVKGAVIGASQQGQAAGKEKLEQARQGIEQGFKEAKEILQSLEIFNGGVQENANKTYDLLHEGLNDIEKQLNEGGLGVAGFSNQGVNQLSYGSQASYARSESVSLQVNTKDGDRVTINVSRESGASARELYAKNNDGESYQKENTSFARAGLSYQVQGQLDEQELVAIDDFVGQVKNVADEFFQGDVQGALHQGLDLGYDEKQIANFSLDLHQEETRRFTEVYREVAQYSPTGELDDKPSKQERQLFSPLKSVLSSLHNMFEEAKIVPGLSKDKNDVAQIFEGVARLDPKHHQQIEALEKQGDKPFKDMIYGLQDVAKRSI